MTRENAERLDILNGIQDVFAKLEGQGRESFIANPEMMLRMIACSTVEKGRLPYYPPQAFATAKAYFHQVSEKKRSLLPDHLRDIYVKAVWGTCEFLESRNFLDKKHFIARPDLFGEIETSIARKKCFRILPFKTSRLVLLRKNLLSDAKHLK